MKNILKNPAVILAFVTAIIMGFYTAYVCLENIKYNVIFAMSAAIYKYGTRYLILGVFLFIDYSVYQILSRLFLVFRSKNMGYFIRRMIIMEIIVIFLFSFFLFFPVVITNFAPIIENFLDFCIFVSNMIVIFIFISSLVSLINVFIKNRLFSIICFFACYTIIDFIMAHIAFMFLEDFYLLPEHIFNFSIVIPNYWILFFALLITSYFLFSISTSLMVRKDYMIKND